MSRQPVTDPEAPGSTENRDDPLGPGPGPGPGPEPGPGFWARVRLFLTTRYHAAAGWINTRYNIARNGLQAAWEWLVHAVAASATWVANTAQALWAWLVLNWRLVVDNVLYNLLAMNFLGRLIYELGVWVWHGWEPHFYFWIGCLIVFFASLGLLYVMFYSLYVGWTTYVGNQLHQWGWQWDVWFPRWFVNNMLMNLAICLVKVESLYLVIFIGQAVVTIVGLIRRAHYHRRDPSGFTEGTTTCFIISFLTHMMDKKRPLGYACLVTFLVCLACIVLPGPPTPNQEEPVVNENNPTDDPPTPPTSPTQSQPRGGGESSTAPPGGGSGGGGSGSGSGSGSGGGGGGGSGGGIELNQPPAFTPIKAQQVTGLGGDKPIRFVYHDEDGKLRMDPEAAAVLQLVKGPIGIVSVCGRARQGKSFLLNQFLARNNGFKIASTHKPCTKDLWLWSAPLKRTALDGTEHNLLFLDCEGIDVYDLTGTYSTQIFSLAVLLSSLLIYNQMSGVDESVLDRPSLVSEMTKHIRVKASGGKSTASELGQFSPTFVWLLRDSYLDLVEDNKMITPRDYLEIALRPMQGAAKDIAGKNEIRESIRALFPDRECFTLVRPLNSEHALQRLDQTSLEKLRPEFVAGLDSLTKFVFERTRPKQVGGTVMTGPILAGITQSFLDALNKGAVPTICSSWQSVEEAECRRAFDTASAVYLASFDCSVPLREAHEVAVQKARSAFNAGAVGAGSAKQECENRLQDFCRKSFEDYKKHAFMDAELKCSNTIQNVDKKLRTACHIPDAKLDHVVKAQAEAVILQKEKTDVQRVAMERLTQIERCEKQIENLQRVNTDLMEEVQRFRAAEMDAVSKVSQLETRLEEREKLIESLLKLNNEQRVDTFVQLNETALDSKLRTASGGKRMRLEKYDMGVESVQDMEIDGRGSKGKKRTTSPLGSRSGKGIKRSKSTTSPLKHMQQAEDGGSVFKGDDDRQSSQYIRSEDYKKTNMTILQQELTKHGFGADVRELKNPRKKELVALYERLVLRRE